MPPLDHLVAFAVAAFVLIVVPGPAVLFTVSRALAYGRNAALATVVGGAIGSFLLAALVSVGVGALVQASALVYAAIKYAGAAYLVYLGVQAIRHRRALREALAAEAAPLGNGRTLVQASSSASPTRRRSCSSPRFSRSSSTGRPAMPACR